MKLQCTYRRIFYAPLLSHNTKQTRLVKAYNLNNGLFAHRIPRSKLWRISYINGHCLPKYYDNRKQALIDLEKLQVWDWTTYKEERDAFIGFYKTVIA